MSNPKATFSAGVHRRSKPTLISVGAALLVVAWASLAIGGNAVASGFIAGSDGSACTKKQAKMDLVGFFPEKNYHAYMDCGGSFIPVTVVSRVVKDDTANRLSIQFSAPAAAAECELLLMTGEGSEPGRDKSNAVLTKDALIPLVNVPSSDNCS